MYNLAICIWQNSVCTLNFIVISILLIKNPDLSALIFGLTEFSFNEMLVSLQYPKKNMMKQQESSPFTTAGKSFEKNYILHGYYICVHHEGTICKNLPFFLYADFVIE